MNGEFAQAAALVCHFNALARGISVMPFFPSNSTCRYCSCIQFLRPGSPRIGLSQRWEVVAEDPNEWMAEQTRIKSSAWLVYQSVNNRGLPDRLSAGFAGGGGRRLILLADRERLEYWEASWEVGNRDAPDRRIWRVRYLLVGVIAKGHVPEMRSVGEIATLLAATLQEVRGFAQRHGLDWFAGCFEKAEQCLSAGEPVGMYHRDLAPLGVLDLQAERLLACCQAAWVFGGMGSWNDLGFDGEEQTRYEDLSSRLFDLLNDGICSAVNASAAGIAG